MRRQYSHYFNNETCLNLYRNSSKMPCYVLRNLCVSIKSKHKNVC